MSRLGTWLRQAVAITPGPVPWRRMLLIGLAVALAESICGLVGHPLDAAFAAIAVYYCFSLDFGGPISHRSPTIIVGLATILACGLIGHALASQRVPRILAVFVLATFGGAIYTVGPRVLQIVRFGIVALLVTSVYPQIGLDRLPPLALGAATGLIIAWIQQRLLGPEPRLQPGGLTQEVRRLSPTSIRHRRFALCYGVVAALSLVVGQALHLQRPYWVTLTTIFTMQPESAQAVLRMFQRVAGTLLAVPVTIGLLSLGQQPVFLMALMAVSAFLIPLANARNYMLSSMTIVIFVIVLLDLIYLSQGGALSLLWLRFYETLIGATLALVGMAVTYAIPLPKRATEGQPVKST